MYMYMYTIYIYIVLTHVSKAYIDFSEFVLIVLVSACSPTSGGALMFHY